MISVYLQPILISIKNSRDAIKHLLSQSGSTHLLVGQDFVDFAGTLELSCPIIRFKDIAFLDDTTFSFGTEAIAPDERDIEREFPAFLVHTSGSTGHPKIIAEVYFIYRQETNPLIYLLRPIERLWDGWNPMSGRVLTWPEDQLSPKAHSTMCVLVYMPGVYQLISVSSPMGYTLFSGGDLSVALLRSS
jgi:hypothetical protein